MIKKIALFSAILLVSLLFIYCTTDEETFIGPFGNASKYISVSSFTADKTLLYSNGDTTIVEIRVLDVDKTPAVGLIVEFTAQFGSITEADTTDSSGVATATFISDDNTGENQIIANTGVKKHTLPLQVVHYQPKFVELFAADPMLLADGVDNTIITATLKDSVGNPMEGVVVNFATTHGSLSSQIERTDVDGVATTELTSSTNDETALVTATSFVTNFVEVEFKQYVPFDIDVSSETYTLLADGISKTEITAIPKDAIGNVMRNIPIFFSTTDGMLSTRIVNTGDDGIARVTLTSTTENVEAFVTVTSYVTKFIKIKFQKYVPSYLELSAGSPLLFADGISSTTITAVLKDSTGKRMEGETVRFSTNMGTLSEEIKTTDDNGVAETILTSGTSEGIAFVTASAYITNFIEIEFSQNVPITIDISASPMSILADGLSTSTITAIPKASDGKRMPSLKIQFSTDLGSLSETIQRTNQEGVATTVLTSGNTSGPATVTAISSISRNVIVNFSAYNPALIELSTEEYSILADGVSEVELTAKVYNTAGDIIPGAIIDFETSYGTFVGSDSILDSVYANQEGKAIVRLRSAGSVDDFDAEITARVPGTSLSKSLTVTFRGISMSTYVDSLEFAPDGIYKAYIRTEVIETSEGIAVEKAATRFSSTTGIMNPEVDGTDDFGRTFSILSVEVTGSDQPGVSITSELPEGPEVYIQTAPITVPGVELLVSSPDNELISTGGGWALAKAIARETNGNASIPNTVIDWSISPIGTIQGKSTTDSRGATIDTLKTEQISSNQNVTLTANYGDNVFDSFNMNFIAPTPEKIILGWDSTSANVVADTLYPGQRPNDAAEGTRDLLITALYADANGNPIGNQSITFSVVPNTNALIWPGGTSVLDANGSVTVILTYRIQAEDTEQQSGEIIRVWAESGGTRGYIDILLPRKEEESTE